MTNSLYSSLTELLSSNELYRPLQIQRPPSSWPTCSYDSFVCTFHIFIAKNVYVAPMFIQFDVATDKYNQNAFLYHHQQGPMGPRGLAGPSGSSVSILLSVAWRFSSIAMMNAKA